MLIHLHDLHVQTRLHAHYNIFVPCIISLANCKSLLSFRFYVTMATLEDDKTTFDYDPFAEGRFRYAYKGKWDAPLSKAGQQCVVKKFKDSYTWERTGLDTTEKIYSRAQQLGKTFGRGIEFTSCYVEIVTRCDRDVPKGVRLNEYIAVEDYLEGSFMKWCNNYGYVSKEARGVDYTLASFMH